MARDHASAGLHSLLFASNSFHDAAPGHVPKLTPAPLCLPTACPAQVKEFDTPNSLLANPHSMFNKLVEDTGPVASAALRQMAAQGPQDEQMSSTGA